MKILFVTRGFVCDRNMKDSGPGNYLYSIAKGLKELGHTPIIMYICDENKQLTYEDIKVYKVNCGYNWIRGDRYSTLIYEIAYRISLRKYIEDIHNIEKFDIVQYTDSFPSSINLFKKVPSVMFLVEDAYLWDKTNGFNISLSRKICYKMNDISMKKIDGVFCPSKLVAHITSKRLRRKVAVYENTFDKNEMVFNYDVYNDKLVNKEYILFVGSLSIRKGIELINKIIFNLLEKNDNIYFIFVGNAKHAKAEKALFKLKKHAKYHSKRIIHLGKLEKRYLYPIMKNAKSVIMPSLADNLPNACIEAMANNAVVVGSREASFDQLINDGYSGFLCNKNSPKSLFNAINKSLTLNEIERQKIGINASRRIERMKPEISVPRLIRYYKKFIE